MTGTSANTRTWRFRDRRFECGEFPLFMGIVNVTPDSFSDGGRLDDVDAAVRHALQLEADGADILDIGGESTRPGAQPVELEEELRRVIPLLQRLVGQTRLPISVDTTKAEVARQAIEAGAEIINDISGLTFDADMPNVCREARAGVICMHILGTPQTMQADPHYDNVVNEVSAHLNRRLDELDAAGIPFESLVLDPGIGFGKTAQHNVEILSDVTTFRALGRPVLIGHSRKRFLGKVLGREVDERLAGTIGVSVALAEQHTDIIRVHDVAATRDALVAWQTIRSGGTKDKDQRPAR